MIAEGESLAAKHRSAGARIDVAWLARWTAGSQRRGGRRRAAARTYLGGVRHGDFPLGLVRAAVALLEPVPPGPRGLRRGAAPALPAWLERRGMSDQRTGRVRASAARASASVSPSSRRSTSTTTAT